MFHAESHSGTRGYAVITKNWGNILFYPWTRKYGATPYAPGNGYTYAKFPTWRAGVRACARCSSATGRRLPERQLDSARWLGTRHGQQATPALPDQHRRGDDHPPRRRPAGHDPALGSLESRAPVTVGWSGTDNRGVTGYQVKRRKGSHPWSARRVTRRSKVLTLATGTWTIAVRAKDAAGNWSAWRKDTVKVTP